MIRRLLRLALKVLMAVVLGIYALGMATDLWSSIVGPDDEPQIEPDPVAFTNFHADLGVSNNGDLDATETVTAQFPAGRHGIFRYWDITNDIDPKVRHIPDVVAVTVDGAPVPYEFTAPDHGRIRVARIGDPERYVTPGEHIYVIRYRIAGVLEPGDVGADRQFATSTGDPTSGTSSFLWNVIAPGWANRIDAATVTVRFPVAATRAQCAVGYGEPEPCALNIARDTVTVQTRELQPHTPVTVRVGIDLPTPARTTLPWSQTWDWLLGHSESAAWWAAALTFGAAVTGRLLARSIQEIPPPFPVQYAPPGQMGPVQAEYIRTEHVPADWLSATAFHLAEHRVVDLQQVTEKQWVIRGVGAPDDWANIDAVSLAVATALGVTERDAEFRADGTSAAGRRLTEAKSAMDDALGKWAIDGGLMIESGRERWLLTMSALLMFVIGVAVLGWFRGWVSLPLMWLAPVVVYLCISLPAMVGAGTRRTPVGRELWSQAGGFHRLLATDSAESRFDFAARKDLYTAYLPYAVAAGSATAWAEKFEAVTGQSAPRPVWLRGAAGAAIAGNDSVDSFDAALQSSLSAYKADQSGGGSGGGGFGGGRGGGGSW